MVAVDADDADALALEVLGRVLVDAVGALAAQARGRLCTDLNLRRRLDLDRIGRCAAWLEAREPLAGQRQPRLEGLAGTGFEIRHGSLGAHSNPS